MDIMNQTKQRDRGNRKGKETKGMHISDLQHSNLFSLYSNASKLSTPSTSTLVPPPPPAEASGTMAAKNALPNITAESKSMATHCPSTQKRTLSANGSPGERILKFGLYIS